MEILFLTERLRSPKSRCWQIQCWVRAHLLIHNSPVLVAFTCGRRGEGQGTLSNLFYKGTDPTQEG